MSAAEQSGDPITAEGLQRLEAEIKDLEGPRRRELAARIKAARELGDLKENAEYHIAKDDQAHLETRIKRLRKRLSEALVIEGKSESDSFAFGRTAEVLDEVSGRLHRWTLVGSTEADLARGRLSLESPVGAALRDRRAGDTVAIGAPGGERRLRIKSLVD
jgi:transcription elongation factor GreA